ncbi:hypothetical protein POMI540_1446 [Schizosaccharomyces pombe]
MFSGKVRAFIDEELFHSNRNNSSDGLSLDTPLAIHTPAKGFDADLSPQSLYDLHTVTTPVTPLAPDEWDFSLDQSSGVIPSPSSFSSDRNNNNLFSDDTISRQYSNTDDINPSDFGGQCAILDSQNFTLSNASTKSKWSFTKHGSNTPSDSSSPLCNSSKRVVGMLRRFLPSSRMVRLSKAHQPLRIPTTGVSLDSADLTPLSVSTSHLNHPSTSNSPDPLYSASQPPSIKTDASPVDIKNMDAAEKLKKINLLLEEILQLDSAYDAAERRMIESGWSSVDEIRDVHNKRLDAWSEWKQKLLPLKKCC